MASGLRKRNIKSEHANPESDSEDKKEDDGKEEIADSSNVLELKSDDKINYIKEYLSNLRLIDIPLLVVYLVNFLLNVKPNKNHTYRDLTPSAWKCFLLICALSYATRMAKIAEPAHVCWDETHFGKFANHYLNGTFFLDVHPPMGKMSLALAGHLTGYNGTFEFHDPGQKFGDHNYVGMRIYCTILGGLCIPLIYLSVWELTQSLGASLLSASFVLFDTGCLTLTQYILLDPILMFWCMMSIYGIVKFRTWNDCPFSDQWWRWNIFTGVSLGCVISVKFIGLFVIVFVGITTIKDLWKLIGDCTLTVKNLAHHFLARAFGLIVVPVTVYLFFWFLHFKYLPITGNGDPFFSAVFQSTLEGNKLHNAEIPPHLAYGSVIALKNQKPGGSYLHSHESVYPPEHPPEQQQITGYGVSDDNNNFKVEKNESLVTDKDPLQYVKDGDVIRLQHVGTTRLLHSHNEKAAITPNLLQVTGYGANGEGDVNDYWYIKVVRHPAKGGKIQAIKTVFRLIHVYTGCALIDTGTKLPKWGHEQVEIACSPDQYALGTEWNIETNIHKKIPPAPIKIMAPSFLEKVWESHVVMMQTNNGFRPKAGEFISLPHQWPTAYKGQAFSGDDHRVYLLGNPVVWWLVLATFGLYVLYYLFHEIRKVRQYEMEEDEKERSDSIIESVSWLLVGWGLHYFPFFIMGRVLYYHHYFPAYLISVMVSGITLEHVTLTVSNFVKDSNLQKKIYHGGIACFLFLSMASFYAFRGLSYGMSGPMGDNPNATQAAYRWLDSWDI